MMTFTRVLQGLVIVGPIAAFAITGGGVTACAGANPVGKCCTQAATTSSSSRTASTSSGFAERRDGGRVPGRHLGRPHA